VKLRKRFGKEPPTLKSELIITTTRASLPKEGLAEDLNVGRKESRKEEPSFGLSTVAPREVSKGFSGERR